MQEQLSLTREHSFRLRGFSYEQVRSYCRKYGDTNQYHVTGAAARQYCEYYGKRTPGDGQVMVPGLQVINRFSGQVIKWFGPVHIGITITDLEKVSFRNPLFTRESVEVVMDVVETGSMPGGKAMWVTVRAAVWLAGPNVKPRTERIDRARFRVVMPFSQQHMDAFAPGA